MLAAVFAGLLALLFLGIPIFAALGGLSLVLLWTGNTPGISVAQVAIDKLNGETILAVPFFVIAAQFMERGGIAKSLIEMAEVWLGRLRGGLALTCVGATTVFAAVSGSSVATALAMATILVPAMLARGYDRPFALGVVGASGTLGILIPPSIILVIYGLIAEASIPRLFLAGIVPGLLQGSLFVAYILIYGTRKQLPRLEAPSLSEFLRANWNAVPAVLIPVVIFVGIYGGYATIAEAAGLAAFLAILVSLLVYRGCSLREVVPITAVAMRRSAAIIMIVVAAQLFGHWLTETRMPARLVEFVNEIDLKGWQFLIMMNLSMLLLGMVLEGLSIVLITVPLVLPLFQQFGIDPVHYAIIVVINIEMAMLTPPVGLNLFVLSSVAKAPVTEVMRGILPFLALMAVLLVAVTFFPQLSLMLPDFVLD
ncbi:TRAP transporter large permease [Frigidibacter sp. ROC022]|uniref:TRAP transporter large permease n=1 Tax=Frigidibacter sp. ROC022 TaxID=2971796 RepID=UPI00215ABA58|nr:TRAP transporter large permease [Frigidibacter sp. ROC022]MCR8725785.1 TRAP transporter large permease [Frigidibacter sp. ROC022]